MRDIEAMREAGRRLEMVTTPYFVKVYRDVCGQEFVLPGAIVDCGRNGERVLKFAPFLDQFREIGDHTVEHVGPCRDPFDYDG